MNSYSYLKVVNLHKNPDVRFLLGKKKGMLLLSGLYSLLSQSSELAGPLARYLLCPDTDTEDQLSFNVMLVLYVFLSSLPSLIYFLTSVGI